MHCPWLLIVFHLHVSSVFHDLLQTLNMFHQFRGIWINDLCRVEVTKSHWSFKPDEPIVFHIDYIKMYYKYL